MEDKILCNVSDLEPIAEAVREKENTNKLYSVEELKVKVPELIGSGGIELPVLTNPATAFDALSGKEFIDGDGNKVIGTIATKTSSNLTASGATVTVPAGYYASQATKSVATATQATPSVSIDSAGKITATATQTAGYVADGTKSGTKQLTTQGAQTITPGTADKTIASGKYLTGTQTIKGDANLVAGNIKSGVSIFGVNGSYEGSGGGSSGSVETCTLIINSEYNDALTCYPACFTVYEDGEVKPKYFFGWTFKDMTLTVVCGSPIVLANIGNIYSYDTTGTKAGFKVSGGVTIEKIDSSKKYIVARAPTTAGATGTIWFKVL